MKKRILLLLAVVLTSLTVSAYDYDFEVDGIYYKVISSLKLTCKVTYGGVKYSGDIAIPSSVTNAGISYSVVEIGLYAFSDCTSLTSIEIPNSVNRINTLAFRYCKSLTSIEIPNSVTEINSCAFLGCTSLTSVVIPNSVTKIDNEVFQDCTNLTSVEIGNSVSHIDDNPFGGCVNLENIKVNDNPNFFVENDCLISNEGLLITGLNKASIVIPSSVTEIGYKAFYKCSSLTSVEIPNSVTEIRNSVFCDCKSLTSVVIPNSVTEIDEWTFLRCSSLTSVEIPNSVTKINNGAFNSCKSLTSIEIPNSVTTIGDQTFSGCTSLMEITSLSTTPPAVKSNTFKEVDKNNCVLKVPAEAVEAYKAADYWKEFLNVEEYDETTGINSIANVATIGKTYGINGAIVGEDYKGIVIRNGKKFVQGL